MNILILTNHLSIGGITRYVLTLSYALKKQGNRVFVGSLPGEGERFLEENDIPWLSLPLKTKSILSPRLLPAYLILKKFIKKENIHLIHAQTRITQFLAFLLSRDLGIPYVSTFHGFYRPHLVRKLFPFGGNLTIAISQAVAGHLIKDFKLNRENLRVIYNSVGPDAEYSADKDYSYLKASPTLGIVARLSKEKGHLILFSAFKQLAKEYPEARLLVVGTGKTEEELKDWVAKENLAERIVFLGNIAQLRSFFAILDLMVLPSIQEGLGYSVLEAQAAGVPVVASSVGGITEVIQDRETGILVEPGVPAELYQAIKLLLGDAGMRRRIVENARKQIQERFSLEKMVAQVEAVYKELVKR
ncbi:glycosyltransferase family 4 protein [Candidatus Omnitrophota bacterium]